MLLIRSVCFKVRHGYSLVSNLNHHINRSVGCGKSGVIAWVSSVGHHEEFAFRREFGALWLAHPLHYQRPRGLYIWAIFVVAYRKPSYALHDDIVFVTIAIMITGIINLIKQASSWPELLPCLGGRVFFLFPECGRARWTSIKRRWKSNQGDRPRFRCSLHYQCAMWPFMTPLLSLQE